MKNIILITGGAGYIGSSVSNFLIDKGLDLQDCEQDIFSNYRGRWDKK